MPGATTRPPCARLFYGPGGMGKTRFFIEACAQMRREGWRAGFLQGGIDARQLKALMEAERPTLAVIDYAESRPDLRDLLKPAARLRASKGRGRLRLVLLARNAGDWWTSLQGADAEVESLLDDHASRALAPLVPAGRTRIAAFQDAAARFAHILGQVLPQATPPLEDRRYDQVLYIHMAALATVSGRPFTAETLMRGTLDEEQPFTAETLMRSILNHEQRFWLSRFPYDDSPNAQRFVDKMRRAVAALTLRGGASSRNQAAELLARTMEERDERLVERCVVLLRALYPGQQSAAGGRGYLGGLEPDLLGEAMVHETLSMEGCDAGAYLDRVLERAGDDALRTAFVVLGRLLDDQPQDAEPWIEHVLSRDVANRGMAAFETAKAFGERTAHARLGMVLARALEREGTIELAARMAGAGLPEHTVSLREVALGVVRKQLEHLPEGSELEALAERARLLSNLGERQSNLGQREAALVSTQEAVAQYRTLSEQRPEAFLPDLAMSLNHLGLMQRELGQREAELASTQEALDTIWPSFIAVPQAFTRNAFIILRNVLKHLEALGQSSTPELIQRIEFFNTKFSKTHRVLQHQAQQVSPGCSVPRRPPYLTGSHASHDDAGQLLDLLDFRVRLPWSSALGSSGAPGTSGSRASRLLRRRRRLRRRRPREARITVAAG